MAENACRVVEWSGAYIEPAPLERTEPGEIIRIEFDLSNDADCAGQGVTISNAVWSIRPDDDDGDLTLSTPITSGLVISTLATIAATETQRMYSVLAVITLSDARVLRRWCSLPVVPMVHAHAA